MRTLVCYRFSDGFRAYFIKGDSEHHLIATPDEQISLQGVIADKFEFKELKIKYSTWRKLLR